MPGRVRGILILFDSDDDSNKTFESVIDSIKQTKLKYPQPSKLLEIKPGDPAMAVATLPWIDKMGHLDELVFEALQVSHADLLEPIRQYCEATSHRTKTWAVAKKSKMRLRCMIAASNEKDPSISLRYYLETKHCPVDFHHPCFDQLMAFIEKFRSSV